MHQKYFLNIWKKSSFTPLEVHNYEPSLAAVLFCVTPQTLHVVKKDSFKNIFFEIFKVIFEECLLCDAQISLFEVVKLKGLGEVSRFLNTLEEYELFSNEQLRAFEDLYMYKAIKKLTVLEGDDFKSQKLNIEQKIKWLQSEIFESEYLKKSSDELNEKLQNAHFSIGVTGVMNAGKSTFLNALFSSEILGTSTVPETANLSIISYSQTPSATVNFWDKKQWSAIETSANNSPALKEFVSKSKNLSSFEEFVKDEGVSKEIDINELSLYTSAKSSNGLCNLVKSVELRVDFPLLQEGISIVDTPGIDDAVVQREEITKEYVSSCDVMIHLMNASQAGTKKDVDFLIDAIIYQRVSRVILLITRVDTIEEGDLKEVINYTKQSIEKQLRALNKPHLVDEILNTIEIFPISSRYALLHRLGKSEQTNGWSLERSGILAVEEAMRSIIYGGQRAGLLLDATKKSLGHLVDSEQKNFKKILGELGLGLEQLKAKKEELNQSEILKNIQNAFRDLGTIKTELNSYLVTMDMIATQKYNNLKNLITQRLNDDISYSVRKDGALPKPARLCNMFDQGVKDGVLDIVRDYRYEFYKQINSKNEPLVLRYRLSEFEYDAKAYKDIGARAGILSFSTQNALEELTNTINRASKKDLNSLHVELKRVVDGFVEAIQTKDEAKLQTIAIDLLEEFYGKQNSLLSEQHSKLLSEQKALDEAIELLGSKEVEIESRKKELAQKIEVLEELSL